MKDEEQIDVSKFTQSELIRHTYREVVHLREDVRKYERHTEERIRALEDFRLLLETRLEVQKNWVRNALVVGGFLISAINLAIKLWA